MRQVAHDVLPGLSWFTATCKGSCPAGCHEPAGGWTMMATRPPLFPNLLTQITVQPSNPEHGTLYNAAYYTQCIHYIYICVCVCERLVLYIYIFICIYLIIYIHIYVYNTSAYIYICACVIYIYIHSI